MSVSRVHTLLSLHVVGHAPGWPAGIVVSQVSPAIISTTPLPHDAEQSLSLMLFAPAGQQPSPLTACVICVFEQPPAAEHESIVHALPSLQSSGVPARQLPFAPQVSAPLHALPSPHDAPVRGVFLQPSTGSHASVVQTLLSLQFGAGPDKHEPFAAHVSAPLQTVLSAHDAPVLGVTTQPITGSHVSLVQLLLSPHVGGTPATQSPLESQNSA